MRDTTQEVSVRWTLQVKREMRDPGHVFGETSLPPYSFPPCSLGASVCAEESSNPEERQYCKRGPCKFLIRRSPLLAIPANQRGETRWRIVCEDDEYMQMSSVIDNLTLRRIRTSCCWRDFTI
jgi:hypothetical protein